MKITPEVLEEMRYLFSIGKKDADIAEQFGLCKATVNLYRNGKQHRNKDKVEARHPPKAYRSESIDYSTLPDTVLFNPKMFPIF